MMSVNCIAYKSAMDLVTDLNMVSDYIAHVGGIAA